ncbi:hypothetical protein [Vibrio parahaemolyticus]|uniref:hypothetical protein n=1 Tax=Vibrio parahaemolyticus TaxID=670 RepID=UPI00320EE8C9
MTTATNILKSFDEQSVHIDYLCFTFAVKDLRHCHDAVRRLHKHEEYKGFAKSGLLQRHCRAPKFPAPPVFNPTVAQTSDEIDAYNKAFDICYRNYLEDCLRIFTNQVLGLSLSAPRGLGFQFYTESMKLTSPDGEDFCGFVGIGGNNDTVHFQINGTGCKHVFARFAASISTAKKFNTKPVPTKRAALDLLASAHWMRRQYGKILNSLIEFHEGDIETVVGSLVRDGTKFTFPDTYGKLVTHILET